MNNLKKRSVWISLVAVVVLGIIIFIGYRSSHTDYKNKAGILYGADIGYSLAAPKGWIIDNEAGKSAQIPAVFYREGETWASSTVRMYSRPVSYSFDGIQNLSELVAGDVASFKRHYNDIIVTDGSIFMVTDKPGTSMATVTIKYFSTDANSRYEAVAYIDAHKAGVIIVMSAKSKDLFEQTLPAFNKLVSSYFFAFDQVNVQSASSTQTIDYAQFDALNRSFAQKGSYQNNKYGYSISFDKKWRFPVAINAYNDTAELIGENLTMQALQSGVKNWESDKTQAFYLTDASIDNEYAFYTNVNSRAASPTDFPGKKIEIFVTYSATSTEAIAERPATDALGLLKKITIGKYNGYVRQSKTGDSAVIILSYSGTGTLPDGHTPNRIGILGSVSADELVNFAKGFTSLK
ncbi:MAG: hypothetical protein WCQ60_02500 [bacterium]